MDGVDCTKQYSLRWEKHAVNLASEAGYFFEDESFLDCTLSAEGQSIQAHKIIISAASSYLSSLLKISPDKHPILIFNDMKFEHLKALVCFIYNGSVSVSQSSIHGFINAAQSLLIRGLSEGDTQEGSKLGPRRLPELNDMKVAVKRHLHPGWVKPIGRSPSLTEDTSEIKRRPRIIPPKDGPSYVECEENLTRLEEISFTKQSAVVSKGLNIDHGGSEEHIRHPGGVDGAYVVKSWKHNSVEDLNGKQKHNKQFNMGSALFKKFKLDRPLTEPSVITRDEVETNSRLCAPAVENHNEKKDFSQKTSPTPVCEKVKDELSGELVLVEPKQEVVDEVMEDDEEEEDTNSEHPDERRDGHPVDKASLFYPQPEGVPVPLLMCRTEMDSGEPQWMGGCGTNLSAAIPLGDPQDLQELPCVTCTKRYKSRYALNRHILYECGKARKSFACDECGKKVTRQDTLQKHKLIHLVQHLKEKDGGSWSAKKAV